MGTLGEPCGTKLWEPWELWEPCRNLAGSLGALWEPGGNLVGQSCGNLVEQSCGNLVEQNCGNLVGTLEQSCGNLGGTLWNRVVGTLQTLQEPCRNLGECLWELLRLAPKPLLWLKTPKHAAVGEKLRIFHNSTPLCRVGPSDIVSLHIMQWLVFAVNHIMLVLGERSSEHLDAPSCLYNFPLDSR